VVLTNTEKVTTIIEASRKNYATPYHQKKPSDVVFQWTRRKLAKASKKVVVKRKIGKDCLKTYNGPRNLDRGIRLN